MLGLGRGAAKEVYAALDWLGREQRFIEAKLARRHLNFLWPPSPRVDGSDAAHDPHSETGRPRDQLSAPRRTPERSA
jgi:hypothetical protein